MTHHPAIPPPQRHYWDISPSELGKLVAPAPKNILIVYYVEPGTPNPDIRQFFDLTKESLACHNPDKTIVSGWRGGPVDTHDQMLNRALWFAGQHPAGDVFFTTATYGNWHLTEAIALALRATTLHIHNGTTPENRAANGIPEGRYNSAAFSPPAIRPAIIVDLDGTLVDSNHRSPYSTDPKEIENDRVVWPVAEILDHYAYQKQYDVLLVSAREGCPEVKEATHRSLRHQGVHSATISFFRDPGDYRPDAAVKLEIFQKHIAPYWRVDLVLDDRPAVVRMWDALGLYVLQARPAKGEF